MVMVPLRNGTLNNKALPKEQLELATCSAGYLPHCVANEFLRGMKSRSASV